VPASATPAPDDLLRRLVAIDSTSSRTNLPVLDLVEEVLSSSPFGSPRIHRVTSEDRGGSEKANLVAWFGPPTDETSRGGLILSGHTDVVPALEPDWDSPPFTMDARGGNWHGRGTADMKGFLALATHLAARVDPSTLAAPLVLLFTHDEEVGTLGAQRLAQAWSGGGPEPLPRACVIGEPTSLRVIRFHKGHLKLRVVAKGRPAHSSLPHLGKNAIEAMGRAIAALTELRRELEGERSETSLYFPEAPFVPLNLGMIAGGVAINVVPEACSLDVGVRLLPAPGKDSSEGSRAVRDRVERAVLGSAKPDDEFVVSVVGDSPPLSCSHQSSIARGFVAELNDAGERGAPYASDGGPLQALGIESVLWGPGSIEVAHRANEFLPIAEFEAAGPVLERLVDRFCR
jgi:acetylornithine deacetylase